MLMVLKKVRLEAKNENFWKLTLRISLTIENFLLQIVNEFVVFLSESVSEFHLELISIKFHALSFTWIGIQKQIFQALNKH